MLTGLSLELLFKSLCVVKGQSFLDDHKLVKLAEIAKVDIKNGEKIILAFFTESVYWEEKYPVPKYERNFVLWKNLRGTHMPRGGTLDKYVQRENEIVGWTAFNGIWSKANQLFWKLHEEIRYF